MSTLTPDSKRAAKVVLVGNPNAGKTSIFNALTGGRQKVGNYPGVTVERASGTLDLEPNFSVEVIDLPGLYTMTALSTDEEVAVEFLEGKHDEKPDLIVVVMDSTQLDRSLFFYSQLSDLGLPTVVALTQIDTLSQHGEQLDFATLADQVLGVPCIKVIAHKGDGLGKLKEAIGLALKNPVAPPPIGREPESSVVLSTAERYEWASEVIGTVLTRSTSARKSGTDKLDRLLTHRVFGFGIFVAIMYVLFQCIYSLAAPIMDAIEWGFNQLSALAGSQLAGIPWLQSLVTDGIIAGVGSVITFLPQILILFFFISVLEGSGYLARAAFMMDRLLGWCGLSGRAFVPLLSSFACAIPGIMAARVMPDAKSRLATILVAPLMSCSARLPVYVLLIGAFIEPKFGPGWAGLTLFAMHFVGLIFAIPVVLILNRKILRGRRLPFVLELPRYQWPKWRDVSISMFTRAATFVQTAGTIIVAMSILMWAAMYFPRVDANSPALKSEFTSYGGGQSWEAYVSKKQTEQSYLGQFGKWIEPAFAPAGFDWRISTAVLSAFPAREVVVPAMSILFGASEGDESVPLRKSLEQAKWPDGRQLFTGWTAVGLMVFFALCCQCMATLATVKRETGTWKWPVFMFTYMTALAYLAAVGIHRLGLAFG